MADGFFEIQIILVFIQVTQELAGDDIPILVDRNGVFEFCAEGEDMVIRYQRFGDWLRIGNVSPGAPDKKRLAMDYFHHRVVGSHVDRAIVGKDIITETVDPFLFLFHDRGILSVRAGGHDEFDISEKKMMKRSVRQHESYLIQIGSDPRKVSFLFEEHDRAAGREESGHLFRADVGIFLYNGRVLGHEGERFCLPFLDFPERADSRWIQRIADKVKSSQPFNGEYLSLFDEGYGFSKSPLQFFACLGCEESDLGAAQGAGDRLGMVSSVERIGILLPARRAHGKTAHRGLLPVVGEGFHDGITGTAVCAVDEGIEITAVRGGHHFAGAVLTH
jgi:hypothetical protein